MLTFLLACQYDWAPDVVAVRRSASSTEATEPLVAPTDLDPVLVLLGRQLFADPGLSADGTVSCASCHDLGAGGDDGRPRSVGIRGRIGARNAPTVLNKENELALFWDGRAATLEDQIDAPLTDPNEMGSSWDQAIAHLDRDPEWVARFAPLGSPTPERIRAAIATFERSLVTLDAPFDRYLRGDPDALDPAAARGWDAFRRYGCVSCHQGRNLGGNLYEPVGVYASIGVSDAGRANVTGDPRDFGFFKVPGLRNVALTAPYFHDGSAPTLDVAVQTMASVQLGIPLTADDLQDIVAFLEALTGDPPGSLRGGA